MDRKAGSTGKSLQSAEEWILYGYSDVRCPAEDGREVEEEEVRKVATLKLSWKGLKKLAELGEREVLQPKSASSTYTTLWN